MSLARQTSMVLSPEMLADLQAVFADIDGNGDGSLDLAELGQALKLCDVEKPAHEVRTTLSRPRRSTYR